MGDLTQQIGEILSDPHAMEQIKALSGLFGQSADAAPDHEAHAAQTVPAQRAPQKAHDFPSPDMLSGMAGAADLLPAIMKAMPLLNAFREDDDSTRLLHAIKPFLSAERQAKLDQAIKLLRILRIVPILKENGILELF